MTQGNNSSTEMTSFWEDLILMVSQNPETLNQINDSLYWIFAREAVWTERYALGHTVTYYSFHGEMFLYFLFVSMFCLREEAITVKGRYEGTERRAGLGYMM